MIKIAKEKQAKEKKSESIKVYSTPTCPYCKLAKKLLAEKGAKFEDINVAKDEKARQDMIEKSGQMGVPVLDIKGTVIIGFDKDAILKALEA